MIYSTITQYDLRLACKDAHEKAERTVIADGMVSGSINPIHYKILCYQLFLICEFMESRSGLIVGDLVRRYKFIQDVAELPEHPIDILPTTKKYLDYLQTLDIDHLKGHIYCHYLGWLYGGQLIAKKLNLPVNHLKFIKVKDTVDYVRNEILKDLTTRDSAEANIAFEAIIEIYEDITK